MSLEPKGRGPAPELGRYRLFDQIGQGGMAEVFLALEIGAFGLDRWVAIKRIRPELAEEARFVQMLLDEARLAAQITHPNVAHVFDLGEAEGTPYIVMEYLRGRPLSEVIKRAAELGRPVDLDLASRMIADACEGVHAAHELHGVDGRAIGLVHRDLSPHNIFITYDGQVKVVDFGIAKGLGRSTRTTPGIRKGKFSYMSPEQVQGDDIDRRSDVYALGLVLYEATTGHRVFEGVAELEERLRGGNIRPPSVHRRGYPKGLEAIVMHALETAKERRFRTAREMAQELERFIVRRRARTDPGVIADLLADLFGNQNEAEVSPAGATRLAKPRSTITRLAPERPAWRILASLRRAPRIKILGAIFAATLVIGGALGAWTAMSSKAEATGEKATPAPSNETYDVSARTLTPEEHKEPPARDEGTNASEDDGASSTRDAGGTIEVESTPAALVYVDGDLLDSTPIKGRPLSHGTHNVKLVTKDGRTKRLRVKISKGRPTSLTVKF